MRFIKNTSHVVNFISSGEGQYQYLSLFVTMSTILITIIIASPIDHNYLYDQILNISQMYLQESETPVNLSCKFCLFCRTETFCVKNERYRVML